MQRKSGVKTLDKELKPVAKDEEQEEPMLDLGEDGTDVIIDNYKDLEIERIKSSRDSSLTWGRLE